MQFSPLPFFHSLFGVRERVRVEVKVGVECRFMVTVRMIRVRVIRVG